MKSQIDDFMEAKKEMENKFLQQYQETWMRQEMAAINPMQLDKKWRPLLERMPIFGRKDSEGSYNFEWPTQYQIEQWDLSRRIQLERVTTNWTSLRSIQLHFTEDISSRELSANEIGYIAKDNLLNISVPRGQTRSIPITKVGLKING